MNEIVMEITPEMEGERIDKCISNYLESLSRSYIQKIIKDGKAYVNDAVVKANYKVKVDDKVQFEIPDCEEPAGAPPVAAASLLSASSVLYLADSYVCVVYGC